MRKKKENFKTTHIAYLHPDPVLERLRRREDRPKTRHTKLNIFMEIKTVEATNNAIKELIKFVNQFCTHTHTHTNLLQTRRQRKEQRPR